MSTPLLAARMALQRTNWSNAWKMALIWLITGSSSEPFARRDEVGIIGRGHPIPHRHASKIDGGGTLMVLPIQAGCHTLESFAPRRGPLDGYDRNQEWLGMQLA